MADQFLTVAFEHIDDRNLHHCVATRLQAHRGASHVDEHLTRKGRIVDTHYELHALVLSLAAHTLASEMNAVSHVADGVYRGHLEYICTACC